MTDREQLRAKLDQIFEAALRDTADPDPVRSKTAAQTSHQDWDDSLTNSQAFGNSPQVQSIPAAGDKPRPE